MKLVIAEKPSVGMSIAKVLKVFDRHDGYVEGNGYIVTWCVGHLVGLAQPGEYDEKYASKKWLTEDLPIIPHKWIFRVKDDTKEQYEVICGLMEREDVDEIVCATDAGREGECIFRYVYNLSGCKKPTKRLWISSMEEKAISEGFLNLKNDKDYDYMFMAGLCRAKADWLVGMNMTRLFTTKYHTLLSIGRVQTPTLNMIVERADKVNNFVKSYSYNIEVEVTDNEGKNIIFAGETKFESMEEAEKLLKSLTETARELLITDESQTNKKTNPPTLYDLTGLQREANKRYGYTAMDTLNTAQALYEAKLITYPRTDSSYITDDMEETTEKLYYMVCALFGDDVKKITVNATPDIKRLINNAKVSDHHALMPTEQVTAAAISKLNNEMEKNILLLICERLLEATADPNKYISQRVMGNFGDEKFSANGKITTDEGFKRVLKLIKGGQTEEETAQDAINKLIAIKKGQRLPIKNMHIKEHESAPPKIYTDNTLLAAMETAGNDAYEKGMEKRGIGTPATRAAILETLVNRGYIERKKTNLYPTEKGIKLIKIVPDDLKSAKMTAEWEMILQNMEKGKSSALNFMEDIEAFVKEFIGKYKGYIPNDSFVTEQKNLTGCTCPLCGKDIVINSKAYTCSDRECGFHIWKTICDKNITEANARLLITHNKTGAINGFKNKDGKTFNAALTLNINQDKTFEIKFVFPKSRWKK